MKKISILVLSVFLIGGFLPASSVRAEENSDTVDSGKTVVSANEEITAEDLGVSDPLILPDNPLYIFKDMWRGLRATFTFNKVKKAELRLEYANKRLFEASKLSKKKGKENIVSRAMEKYQQEIQKINEQAKRFKETVKDNPEIGKFLDKFTDKSIKQQELMDILEKNLSERPEVLARIRKIKESSLEKFGVVMEKLEEKHKIQKRIENNLDENGTNTKYKNFKNLEVLIRLEDKVSEEAKKAIQQAQVNALKRLHGDLKQMSLEDQGEFGDYVDKIGGDPATHLLILKRLEKEASPYELRKELKEKRIEIQERTRELEKNALEVKKQVQKQLQVRSKQEQKDEKPKIEKACVAVWAPVCGENGKTYSNTCFAKTAGIEVSYKGKCRAVGNKVGQ